MPGKRNARNPRVEWSDEMNMFLLKCRDQAKTLVSSENPPRKTDGRKMGYMKIMHDLFLERFPELKHLNPQNLRDKITHAEQLVKISQTSLTETFNSEQGLNANAVNVETNNPDINYNNIDYVHDELNGKECEAFKISNNMLVDLLKNVGDMSGRQWSTRNKKIPLQCDITSVNKIVHRLMSLHGLDKQLNEGKYFDGLWKLNCITYVAIISWYKVNDIKCQIKTAVPSKEVFQPKWLKVLDEFIFECRRLISQCVAELDRIKRNGRATRKMLRNREKIEAEIGKISVYSLTKYIMKLKAQIHRKARSRKRKLRNQVSRDYNSLFRNNQGRVFRDFKAVIDKKSEEEHPTFEKLEKSRKFFTEPDDVITFWKALWEKEDVGRPDAEWLTQYNDLFETVIPEVNNSDIVVTKQIVWNCIKKKRNWSAPGPDGVVNFWLKKIVVIHDAICVIFNGIINSECNIVDWYVRGVTVLLEKLGEWLYSNTRPITCTNNMYKWLSSVLLYFFDDHAKQYNLMQSDQRGAKSKCSGTLQNLLIDNMVLNDAHDHHRNLSCGWVDVSKAYDSLSHKWIEKMLEIHRFPGKIASVISKIISTWNTKLIIPLENGDVYSDPIQIKTGVFQGDVISGNLYTLSKNPISWELRRFDGYTLSKPIQEKITHSLFIDDLKCYNKSVTEQKKMMSHAKSLMNDAGLEWNIRKTNVLNMKKGKVDVTEDLTLNDGSVVKCLANEDVYKFLGVPESELHDIENLVEKLKSKVTKRTSVVLSSPLSDHNKVHAINVWVHACVEYFMWSERIKMSDLRDLDSEIRNLMNIYNAKYKLQINSSLYLPRSMGGRGLKQFEATYKMTKIKSAVKLITESEPKMKLVRRWDILRKQKKRSSLINDAIKFAKDDFDSILEPLDEGFTYTYNKGDTEETTSDISVLGNVLKSQYRSNLLDNLCKSTWQGVIMKERMNDNSLIIDKCFMWLSKWKDCPVDIINDVHSIYLQTVPTLTFKKFRGQSQITSTACRICHIGLQESVKHLLSNCGRFAKSIYIRRHNRVLQYILFHVLRMYELIEKCPPWFADVNIQPHYENDDITLLWDIPEYSGVEEEDDDRVLRPDGKLILKKKKVVFVLEMSVPWISNREVKVVEKEEKYENIIRSLKLQYPDHHVEQLTFIVDCLGGFSKSLVESLKKLDLPPNTCDSILLGIQKIVVGEARSLINVFKILTL